ncbi:MAG: TlpA family protein disulfide reductase [Flavobacteriales bacterium]|nr:TlpA family protein disulfide reductase [Flavobacteriales bacterium]MCB9190071.1 TlpA family protein disulfide reductase [Flavobacteriales bacterium]
MRTIGQISRPLAVAFVVLASAFSSSGQNVPVIGLDDLESRLNAGKDTTFVVNFWATWCGPCVKELPYFEALELANRDKPLKVLLVSLDFANQLETKVIPFVQTKELVSEVVLMDEDKPNKWIPRVSEDWTGALPATLFTNKEKKTRHFHEGSFKEGELELKLKELDL